MILGIDVGIRNLAYCRRNHKRLHSIEIIDLLELYNEKFALNKRYNNLTYKDVHHMHALVFKEIFTKTFIDSLHHVNIENLPPRSKKKIWLLTHLIFSTFSRHENIQVNFIHGQKKFIPRKDYILSTPIDNYMKFLNNYKSRKLLSTQIFKAFMAEQKICIHALGNKLDDAADALLLTYCS